MSLIQLYIKGISYSQTQTGAYALILEEERTHKKMPIIIGPYEAQSIAIALEHNITPPRPLTHDLFVSLGEAFDLKLKEVVIYKLLDGIFHSYLLFEKEGKETKIDARTSDACALAVRFQAPIFTSSSILNKAGIFFEEPHVPFHDDVQEDEEEKLQDLNDELDILLGRKSAFSEFSEEELLEKLEEAVQNEDYEKAALIKDELDKRKS